MEAVPITTGSPFHQEDYREDKRCKTPSKNPIIDILIGESKTRVSAYVDTGCSPGICIFKDQTKGIDLGIKISDEVSRCIVADGDIIGAEEYVSKVCINGEERVVTITVIDPECRSGHEEAEEMIPLLGRNFLDYFDVHFRRKAKRIALFK